MGNLFDIADQYEKALMEFGAGAPFTPMKSEAEDRGLALCQENSLFLRNVCSQDSR